MEMDFEIYQMHFGYFSKPTVSPPLAHSLQFSSVQSLSPVWLFATAWTTACQTSLFIINSWSSLKLMFIEAVMPSSHLIFCRPPSPPALNPSQHQGLFQRVNSSHEVAKVLEFSALASVLPMNTQDWSALGWTGWISLQSKGLSRVFSNTTVQKCQLFSAQLSSLSNSNIYTLTH